MGPSDRALEVGKGVDKAISEGVNVARLGEAAQRLSKSTTT